MIILKPKLLIQNLINLRVKRKKKPLNQKKVRNLLAINIKDKKSEKNKKSSDKSVEDVDIPVVDKTVIEDISENKKLPEDTKEETIIPTIEDNTKLDSKPQEESTVKEESKPQEESEVKTDSKPEESIPVESNPVVSPADSPENSNETAEIEANKDNEEKVIDKTENEKDMNRDAKETNNDIDLVVDPDEIESPDEDSSIEDIPEKTPENNSTSLMQIISYLFFGSIAFCLLLSCYYRLHLLKNKRAPFNAPKGLKPLFPTPVNYEYEITQLCDKYLAN